MDMGIFILIALVILAVVIGRWIAGQKRREALAAEARRLGLQFSADDPFQIPEMYAHFSDFTQGHSRCASNVMSGKLNGLYLMAFDYRYVTGSGKSQTTHCFSAIILTVDCVFPGLQIRPENFLDKLAAMIGFDDINFESDEFSRRFHVTSEDRKFAYAVIHPRMMEFLLADPAWNLTLDDCNILVRQGTNTWAVGEFIIAIDFIRRFLALVPDYVIKDLETRGAPPESTR